MHKLFYIILLILAPQLSWAAGDFGSFYGLEICPTLIIITPYAVFIFVLSRLKNQRLANFFLILHMIVFPILALNIDHKQLQMITSDGSGDFYGGIFKTLFLYIYATMAPYLFARTVNQKIQSHLNLKEFLFLLLSVAALWLGMIITFVMLPSIFGNYLLLIIFILFLMWLFFFIAYYFKRIQQKEKS